MAKRQRDSKNALNVTTSKGKFDSFVPAGTSGTASKRVRLIVSAAVILHFGMLLIALSANLAPSYLQGKLTNWLSVYLVTTAQDYGGIPLELTHADPIDFPVLVEVRSQKSGSWKGLQLPGAIQRPNATIELTRSRWANFGRLICLITIDRPDNEILADIAAHLVSVSGGGRNDEWDAIRFVTPKILSYDEYALVGDDQMSLRQELAKQEVIYSARIIRNEEQTVLLVPDQERSRTAKPTSSRSPQS